MGAQAEQKSVKRGQEVILILASLLKVDTEFNARLSYDGEEFEELKNSILENGVQDPLKVKKGEDGYFHVIDGHRRALAIQELLKQKDVSENDIGYVPVIKTRKHENEEDAILDIIIQNDGKPLNLLEEGIVFRRMEKKGYSKKEIAKKTGRPYQKVVNGLVAASAPKKVQDYVAEGKISPTAVMHMMREFGKDAKDEDIIQHVEKALKAPEGESSEEASSDKKSGKKKKATSKDVSKKANVAPLSTIRKLEKDLQNKKGVKPERLKLLSELREAFETGKKTGTIEKLFKKGQKLEMKTVPSKKKSSKSSSKKGAAKSSAKKGRGKAASKSKSSKSTAKKGQSSAKKSQKASGQKQKAKASAKTGSKKGSAKSGQKKSLTQKKTEA